MNDTGKSLIVATSLGLLLILGSGNELLAKERSPRICTKGLVSGVYGFNARGFVVEGEEINPDESQAGAGIVKLRRNGMATFTVTRFFAGVPSIPDEEQPLTNTFLAKWTLNSDCTGMVILDEGGLDVGWKFVAVDDGNEIHFVSGATLTAVDAKRITNPDVAWSRGSKRDDDGDEKYERKGSRFKCSMKSVAGVYGGNFDTFSGHVDGPLMAFVGTVDLLANGSATLKRDGYVVNQSGMVEPFSDMGPGTWEVKRDCTGNIEFDFQDNNNTVMVTFTFVAVESASEILAVGGGLLEEFDGKRIFSSRKSRDDHKDDD